jgi:hypothetical protein
MTALGSSRPDASERDGGPCDAPGGRKASRHLEAEMLFHGQEITIVVQQSVAMLDAESADDNGS